jgi:hypothetical protein
MPSTFHFLNVIILDMNELKPVTWKRITISQWNNQDLYQALKIYSSTMDYTLHLNAHTTPKNPFAQSHFSSIKTRTKHITKLCIILIQVALGTGHSRPYYFSTLMHIKTYHQTVHNLYPSWTLHRRR